MEELLVSDDQPHRHHHHCPCDKCCRKRRRRCVGFWVCCCICAVVIPLLIAAFITSIWGLVLASTAPATSPIAIVCNYSEWSSWSYECLEVNVSEYVQVRSMYADPPYDQCPQLFEYQECDIFLTFWFTRVTYEVNCEYDIYSNLCNGSNWVEYNDNFGVTNATDLDHYQSVAPSIGWIDFFFGSIYPCLPECPLTNTSASIVPVPPGFCEYGEWSEWSSTCLEYPTGNFSVSRTAVSDPYYSYCPALLDQRSCSPATCSETFLLTTYEYVCIYNTTTNLCQTSTRFVTDTTWCVTNATDLNTFFNATVGDAVTNFFPGIVPCMAECPVTNGSVPFSPSPSDSSPLPACTYTAWSAWSSTCLEYPTGVFSQVRTRQPNPAYSFCLDTAERMDCDALSPSCAVWQDVSLTVNCQYDNATGLCNSSSTIQTTTDWCVTNATNMSIYFASVAPGTVVFNLVFGIQPCLSQCLSVDSDCIYGDWGNWSFQCMELGPGVFQQLRTRVSIPPSPTCLDLLDTQDCDLATCTNWTYTTSTPSCEYSSVTAQCVSSSLDNTFSTLCSTNATDFEGYLAAYDWPTIHILQYFTEPCVPQCPAFLSFPPSPAATPSVQCMYSAWSLWSFQCVEYPPGNYNQFRTKTATPAIDACPDVVARRVCSSGLVDGCQGDLNITTTFNCFYNASNLCYQSVYDELRLTWCFTNATNLTDYYANVAPFGVENFGIDIPCDPACPATNTTNQTAVTNDYSQVVIPPNIVPCPPPYYRPPNGSCVLCANHSLCTVGSLDVEKQTCTQVDKCADGGLCSIASCDTLTGNCMYTPLTQNLFNSSYVCYCNDTTGVSTCYNMEGFTVTVTTDCSDGDPNTIDSYDNFTQTCKHVELYVPPDPLTITSCFEEEAFVPNPGTDVDGLILNGFYTCANPNEVCVNNTCIPVADSVDTCYYYAYGIGVHAADPLATRELFYDDDRCTLDFPDMSYKSCNPLRCPFTKTGCGECVPLQSQNVASGLVITYLPVHTALAVIDCKCCRPTPDPTADCQPGFTCHTDLFGCVPDI